MRCKNCPYEDYDYQEGYPTCRLFGDNEDYCYENAKGELGCRYNQRGLQKFVRLPELEEQDIVRQMGDFAKWCKEHPNPPYDDEPATVATADLELQE
jgi:hypothetical protein